MPLKRIDLNLFKVFEAVMARGTMTGAAKQLGVTPSAVSHAIGRLREALHDELFVYSNGRMTPTIRSLDIAPDIRSSLDLLAISIADPGFDPARSTRVFRISTTDYGAVVLISRLVERLAEIAPNIELRLLPYSRCDVLRTLDDGAADFVVGWFDEVPRRIRRTHLLTEKELLLVRKNHPMEGTIITDLDEILAYSLITVERDSAAPMTLSLPYYYAVPSMLRYSDMVAVVPEGLAKQLTRGGEFVTLHLSFPANEVNVEAVWHERGERDQALQWLLGQLAEAVSSAAPDDELLQHLR